MPGPIDIEGMRAPLPYYGGKQRLSSRLVAMLPEHDVYCEPFAGAAAVFFAKKPSRLEVLNDHDDRIINFFRVLRDPVRSVELISLLELVPYSRREFDDARAGNMSEGIEGAANYAITLSFSFSAQLGTGWSYCKAPYKNTPHGPVWVHRVARLRAAAQRIRMAQIDAIDAAACIELYDSPLTCFYVDPPYPGANQGHYRGYTQEAFDSLCDLLDNIRGKFLLSCYDNPAPPDHWGRVEFKAYASASAAGTTRYGGEKQRGRTEVVWTNFDAVGQVELDF